MRQVSMAMACAAICLTCAGRSSAAEFASQLRHPVALAFSSDQHWLYVANQRSGSVSVLDLERRQLHGEHAVGRQLTALQAVDGQRLAALDWQTHQLVLLSVAGPQVAVKSRVDVAQYPVGMALLANGRLAVSSLWSRRLTFVDLQQQPPRVEGTLDLEWAPRELLPLPDGRLLVADAFGGQLGIVDPQARKLQFTRKFPAHNIRGLALTPDGKMLAIAHQMLNELAHTVRNDIHWGLLMSNDLRWVSLQRVLDPQADLYVGAHMHQLGEPGSAAADPAGAAIAGDGTAIVTAGGVGEVAIGKEHDFSLKRLAVGRRPTAVVVSDDSRLAAVADTFGNSVSLIDLQQVRLLAQVSLGPAPELTLADKGEQLFYAGKFSHDQWMSCHSCHTDGHTNGQVNDNLSDHETFGAPKRVLSLLGKRDTLPLAWNGSSADYPSQIVKSIVQTMQSDQPPRPREVKALAAYLETLQAPPSLDAARGRADPQAIGRGRTLFSSLNCQQCHAAPAYTSPELYDVGLQDELGHRQFNPPSLRGVSQRGPYFHDCRAATLRSVFEKHQHQLERPLSPSQLKDLLAFLRSL